MKDKKVLEEAIKKYGKDRQLMMVVEENDGKETFSETQQQIIKTCDDLKEFLLEKNRSYGDSALNPVRIFSNADPVEQIKVRLDDKISRLKGGGEYLGDDTIKDLAGYLILFIIATTSPER